MKDWLAVLGLVVAVFVISAVVYVGSSSIRYGGPSDKEYGDIELAGQVRDVEKLNRILITSRSPSTKLIVMYHLERIKSPTSVPALLQTLSYDLPWWDKLDTELRPRPFEVRFSSYRVLSEYGDSIAPELRTLAKSRAGYKQMYAAALLYKLGHTEYREVLEYYAELDERFEEEMDLIARDLSLNRY